MGDAAEVAARQMASEWFAAANRDILRLTAERDAAREEAARMRRVAGAEHTKHMAALVDADRLREALTAIRDGNVCNTGHRHPSGLARAVLSPPPGEPTEDPVDVRSVRPGWVQRDDGKIVLRVPLREVFECRNAPGEPTEDCDRCQNVGHWIGGEVGAPGGHDGGDGLDPCDTGDGDR